MTDLERALLEHFLLTAQMELALESKDFPTFKRIFARRIPCQEEIQHLLFNKMEENAGFQCDDTSN